MSVSHIASDRALLAIWHASLLLAALSLFILLILIIRRGLEGRAATRQRQRIAELSVIIKAALTAPVIPSDNSLPPLAARDRPLVRVIALNFLRTILGSDAQRMTEILRAWNMKPYLQQQLQSRSRGLRIQALTLLAYFPSNETTALLLEHVKEADTYVQMAALRGLALPEHAAHLPSVIQILAASEQRNTAMLADILQRFGAQGVAPIVTLANQAHRVEMQLAAIAALARIGDFAALPALSALSGSTNSEIRAAAVAALGQLGAVTQTSVILEALKDKEVAVLIQAVQVAGKFQIQEAMPLLAEYLQADDWWLRFRAAEALYHMGGPGVTLLRTYSTQANRSGQIAAAVLAEKGSAFA